MADTTTFIKLDRNIQEWRWYQDANTMRVFIDLLLNVNIVDHEFQGITIHRGETATSYESIAKKLGLSIQNVRTAINHLKSTGEITATRYSKFQVISVLNYDVYQRKPTDKLTVNQQSTNNQLTVNQQQLKNNKNNKERKEEISAFAQGEDGEDEDEETRVRRLAR